MRREAREVAKYEVRYPALHDGRIMHVGIGNRDHALNLIEMLRSQMVRYGGNPETVELWERTVIVTEWKQVN
jgi:hypothetical protein